MDLLKAKDIKFDFILDYCTENNELEWLNEVVNSTYVNDAGETKDANFPQVKKAFIEKFYPELAPKKKANAMSMKDLVKLAMKGNKD